MFRVAESLGHHLRVMPQFLLLGVVLFQAPTSLAAQDLLYVASQEEVTVSVIDTRSNELLETVDLNLGRLFRVAHYFSYRLQRLLPLPGWLRREGLEQLRTSGLEIRRHQGAGTGASPEGGAPVTLLPGT